MPHVGINDIVGSIGVILILGSYLLVQMDRLTSPGLRYSIANAIGAGMIAVSLLVDFNLYALVVEVAWLLISLFGVVRSTKNGGANPDKSRKAPDGS